MWLSSFSQYQLYYRIMIGAPSLGREQPLTRALSMLSNLRPWADSLAGWLAGWNSWKLTNLAEEVRAGSCVTGSAGQKTRDINNNGHRYVCPVVSLIF